MSGSGDLKEVKLQLQKECEGLDVLSKETEEENVNDTWSEIENRIRMGGKLVSSSVLVI